MIEFISFTTCNLHLILSKQSLDSKGCTFAAGFSDGVLRFVTHSLITPEIQTIEFRLQYVFKPHKGAIKGISFAMDGTNCCTIGEDKTVFFFKIEKGQSETPFDRSNIQVEPIGFVQMESAASSFTFSPDNHLNVKEFELEEASVDDDEDDSNDESGLVEGKKALMVLNDGQTFTLVVPPIDKVDTKITYQLSNSLVNLKEWKLDVPQPKPPQPTVAPISNDGAANNSATSADGNNTEVDLEVELAKSKDGKDSQRLMSALRSKRGLVISSDSPVNLVYYLEGGYFLAAVTNKFGEGEIRCFKVGSPNMSRYAHISRKSMPIVLSFAHLKKMSRLILVYKVPFSDLKLSLSGKYIIAGAIDGMTCVRKIQLDDLVLYNWKKGHETYAMYSESYENAIKQIKTERDAMIARGEYDPSTSRVDEAQYWFGHVHDCDRGIVSSVAFTFDDAYLCSSGLDGGIFLFRNTIEPVQKNQGNNPSVLIKSFVANTNF
jgi:WD40 repeat protein